jgi:flagellar biosynthetic protein FliQ
VSESLVLSVVRQALETAVIITLPMLAAGLVVGVIVSVLQTVTSIQDNILAFIPRAAAIFVVFAFTFPWMLRVVTSFAAEVIRRLPDLVR